MEENQNKGVDLSDYLNSRKANTFAQLSDLEKNKAKNEQKNKIYIAIIIVCVLIMAGLWSYYSSQNSEPVKKIAPAAETIK